MTWKNHRATTLALVYAATGWLPAAFIAMLSSTLPDRLEMGILKHRTITHWPVIGILFVIIPWYLFNYAHSYWALVVLFIGAGYVSHLFEDLLSRGGIPFLLPESSPVGLDLYITGQKSENITAYILIFLGIIVAWQRGFWSVPHLSRQLDLTSLLLNRLLSF